MKVKKVTTLPPRLWMGQVIKTKEEVTKKEVEKEEIETLDQDSQELEPQQEQSLAIS